MDPYDDETFSVGNASENNQSGWFVGPFLKGLGIRHTDRVQIKWGVHQAGDRREKISDGFGFCSAAVLVNGSFLLEFPSRSGTVLLSRPGDYVLYGPELPHSWQAVTDSTLLTVRWPTSRPR